MVHQSLSFQWEIRHECSWLPGISEYTEPLITHSYEGKGNAYRPTFTTLQQIRLTQY